MNIKMNCYFAIALLGLSAAGCGEAGPGDVNSEEQGPLETDQPAALEELAAVETPEGATFVISEGEPGELLLESRSTEEVGLPLELMDRLDAGELSFVEFYEALAGAPAPEALLDAQLRADSLLASAMEADDVDTDTGLENQAVDGRAAEDAGEGLGRVTQSISASSYADNYCGHSGWDYNYCWPSTGGNPWVQRKAFSMRGCMAAVNVVTRFRFRYKKVAAGSWITSFDKQALPGEVHCVSGSYFGHKRWRRWEILNNDGHAVRYSAYGNG